MKFSSFGDLSVSFNNCFNDLAPLPAAITPGMQVDYNTRNYCFPFTVKEVSLRAKFVNTSQAEGTRIGSLRAASASRTWPECPALNHYDLQDIR